MNDGGPAFPRLYARADEDGRGGMSLRDWFAGMALVGLMHAKGQGDIECYHLRKVGSCEDNGITQPFAIADHCYLIADAMLKAREVPNA